MTLKKQHAFQLLTGIAALGASALASESISRGYKVARKKDLPQNPASRRTDWSDALIWAAISGAVASMTAVVARDAASRQWQRRVGRLPRGTV